MMHGSSCLGLLGAASAGPEPGGSNLIASLDFVNGIYSVNSVTQTVGQVVNLTGRVSGNGLSVISGTPVQLLGATLTMLLTFEWSIVITFSALADAITTTRCFLLTLWDTGLSNQIALYTIGDGALMWGIMFEGNGGTERFVENFDDAPGIIGINKLGYTSTIARCAVSTNGCTAVSDTTSFNATSFSPALTQAQAADGNNGTTLEGYIRKIEIYDVVDGATLASLTSLI